MNPAEEYIISQPEPYRTILMYLQIAIEKTILDVDLKFKWKVAFYYVGKRPICYLHKPKGKDYIDLVFWNAAHLKVNQEHMTIAGLKMMKSLRYKSLEEIDDKILIEILKDAYSVRNKKFWKN